MATTYYADIVATIPLGSEVSASISGRDERMVAGSVDLWVKSSRPS